MPLLDNLNRVEEKLNFFIDHKDVPNLLFHGTYNTNKEEIVFDFLDKIYSKCSDYRRKYVMYVNCAYGTGIKFIRENIKFFAKTHNYPDGDFSFKTIVLSNAEYLTPDAQSAMRRCIEEFSKNTRFIFITNDKQKILAPILSRFCEIFVYNDINQNLQITNPSNKIDSIVKKVNKYNIFDTIEECVDKGISGIELLRHIISIIPDERTQLHYKGLMNHYMGIIHNERIFMYAVIDNYLNRNRLNIKNKPFV
jgi:DNA polymerase III delta prime subunit